MLCPFLYWVVYLCIFELYGLSYLKCKLSQIWPGYQQVDLSRCLPLDMLPSFFWARSTFLCNRYSSLGNSHFPKEPWFVSGGNGIRNQYTRCALCYWLLFFKAFLAARGRKYIYTHTRKYKISQVHTNHIHPLKFFLDFPHSIVLCPFFYKNNNICTAPTTSTYVFIY